MDGDSSPIGLITRCPVCNSQARNHIMCESSINMNTEISDDEDEEVTARRLVRQTLQKLTYKPGYYFSWESCEDLRIKIILNTPPLPDVCGNGSSCVSLTYWDIFLVEECLTRESVIQCIRRIISGWEEHEMLEWLRFDGKLFSNPHSEEFIAGGRG